MPATKITPTEDQKTNLKSGLILWAEENAITPADFARVMGYQYPTAWDILRGKRDFTSEAFGRFTLKYGTKAAAKLLKLADLPDGVIGVEVLPNGEKRDGKTVLVVTQA